MAAKAKSTQAPVFKAVADDTELLVEDLREKVQQAVNASAHHKAVLADKQNEVSAWAKLQKEQEELSFLIQIMQKHNQPLVVDADTLRKQVSLGLNLAQVNLGHAEAERDIDPLYQISKEIEEHEKAVKAERAKAQAEAEAAALAEMDNANRELRKAAYADGRWATWTSECENLKGSAKVQAKKDRNDGEKATVKQVRAVLRIAIAKYLGTVGLQQSRYVGDRLVTSKTFDGYVEELVKTVDPDRVYEKDNKTVAANVSSFTDNRKQKNDRKPQRANKNPKAQRRDDGADKPNADGTPEDIANYFLGKEVEESADGAMASALNAAGVKAS